MKLNDSRRKPGAIIEAESLRKPAIDETNLTSGCSFRRFVMPGKRLHITRCAPRKPRTVPQISRNTISHRLNRLWQISVPQGQNGGHHCHKGDLAPSPAIIQSNRAKIPTNAPMSQAGRSASRVCPDEAATTDGTLTANAITAMRKQSQPDSLRDGRSVGITTELSDADGPEPSNWQVTWPARIRCSDFVRRFRIRVPHIAPLPAVPRLLALHLP